MIRYIIFSTFSFWQSRTNAVIVTLAVCTLQSHAITSVESVVTDHPKSIVDTTDGPANHKTSRDGRSYIMFTFSPYRSFTEVFLRNLIILHYYYIFKNWEKGSRVVLARLDPQLLSHHRRCRHVILFPRGLFSRRRALQIDGNVLDFFFQFPRHSARRSRGTVPLPNTNRP